MNYKALAELDLQAVPASELARLRANSERWEWLVAHAVPTDKSRQPLLWWVEAAIAAGKAPRE